MFFRYLVRSAGVLLGRYMASRHHKGEGTAFRSRLPLVLAHIEAHLADELPLDKLAAMAGMSVSAFRRNFALVTGMRPISSSWQRGCGVLRCC